MYCAEKVNAFIPPTTYSLIEKNLPSFAPSPFAWQGKSMLSTRAIEEEPLEAGVQMFLTSLSGAVLSFGEMQLCLISLN